MEIPDKNSQLEKKKNQLNKFRKSSIESKKQEMYKKAIRKIHKTPLDPGEYRKRIKRTKPEKAMIKILEDLGIEDYEVEYSIYALKMYKVYDFKVGENLLIEVDGDFIHGNRESGIDFQFMHLKVKENDALKNVIAKSNGFNIIRFWQSTIENDPDLVKQKIIKYLQKS